MSTKRGTSKSQKGRAVAGAGACTIAAAVAVMVLFSVSPVLLVLNPRASPVLRPNATETGFVFVTSGRYTPADIALAGGPDLLCAAVAANSSLPSVVNVTAWVSWTDWPRDRWPVHCDEPYILTDGTVVAHDWDDLTDGSLHSPIHLDENGANILLSPLPLTERVWTSVLFNGMPPGADLSCSNWTSANGSFSGFYGHAAERNARWSIEGTCSCSRAYRLYCFSTECVDAVLGPAPPTAVPTVSPSASAPTRAPTGLPTGAPTTATPTQAPTPWPTPAPTPQATCTVFLTRATFNGSMDGLAGMDARCAAAAAASSLAHINSTSNEWRAWAGAIGNYPVRRRSVAGDDFGGMDGGPDESVQSLGHKRHHISLADETCLNRMVPVSIPYALPSGAYVAGSLANFASASHFSPINEDENGVVVTDGKQVWTGCESGGAWTAPWTCYPFLSVIDNLLYSRAFTYDGPDGINVEDRGSSTAGIYTAVNQTWSYDGTDPFGSNRCQDDLHLYCLQQNCPHGVDRNEPTAVPDTALCYTFVTEELHGAVSLSGLSAADAICQNAAESSRLAWINGTHQWKAWFAPDFTNSPADSFVQV